MPYVYIDASVNICNIYVRFFLVPLVLSQTPRLEVVESEESERLDETLRLRSEIVRIKAQGAAARCMRCRRDCSGDEGLGPQLCHSF